MRIKPFKALRPPQEIARLVASVPYDTVDTGEARALAEGNPKSFLRIDRPEINLPGNLEEYTDEVFAAAENEFKEFREKRFLIQEPEPSHYIYRIETENHAQHGLVTCCHIEDYENNVIKRHETTRKIKEIERTRHMETLNAHPSPVFITYKDSARIDEITEKTELQQPLIDFTDSNNIRHTIWKTPDPREIIDMFRLVPFCYIADGHHRGAAAYNFGTKKRKTNPAHTGEEEYNWFLSILFPATQLRILPYNRCVKDLNGMDENEFIKKVKQYFKINATGSHRPSKAGAICMYIGSQWYELNWAPTAAPDQISSLDVSVLQSRLLAPILGIEDPRKDTRIEFIGGNRGTDELVKLVDTGQAAVAFSMHPVSVFQMMAIADACQIMPPKSTWFDPKPLSGLFVHCV